MSSPTTLYLYAFDGFEENMSLLDEHEFSVMGDDVVMTSAAASYAEEGKEESDEKGWFAVGKVSGSHVTVELLRIRLGRFEARRRGGGGMVGGEQD